MTGSFVLLDVASGRETIVGREDADRPHVPFSSFKIPNTLIGLETGVIPDEQFALKWDGTVRAVDSWNRDHDLPSAMKHSAVWFYQEVARRIGEEQMTSWVARLGYGNREVHGAVEAFWLDDGSIRISPREQVAFLRRLLAGELPVSKRSTSILERIFPAEALGTAIINGKTGLGHEDGQAMGWFVGWVDAGSKRWIYATHVRSAAEDLERMIPLRRELTHALLRRANVIR